MRRTPCGYCGCNLCLSARDALHMLFRINILSLPALRGQSVPPGRGKPYSYTKIVPNLQRTDCHVASLLAMTRMGISRKAEREPRLQRTDSLACLRQAGMTNNKKRGGFAASQTDNNVQGAGQSEGKKV